MTVTGYSGAYDGNTHTASLASAFGVDGKTTLTGTFTSTVTSSADAGSYPDNWQFTPDNLNYSVATGTVTDVINQAAPTVQVAGYTVTYDGSSHSASLASAVGLDGVTQLTGAFAADSQTNAGTYTDSWKFTPDNLNYSVATGTVTDVINQAAPTVQVAGYTVTYDGSSHSASLASAVGLDGVTQLTGAFAADSQTNAGTYTDSWTFTPDNLNYSVATGTVTDVINQAAPTVQVAGYTVTYDGNAHSASLTSAVGLDGVTQLTGTFAADSQTNAGTYTDSWKFTPDNLNYSVATGTITDIINQAAPTVQVTGYTVTYDGSSRSASLASAVGLDGVTQLTGTFAADSQTNAGTYTDSWKFTPDNLNYSVATGTVADVINQAAPMVQVAGYTITYDGSAHSASLTSAVGLDGTTQLKGTFAADSQTNAGTYTDSWTFTPSDSNYSVATGAVKDVINQAAPTVLVTGYTGTYDGGSHSASLTSAVGLHGVTQLTGAFAADSHTNAGTYTTDSWSFTPSDTNYSVATGTVVDTINQAAPTVVVAGYSGTYDGGSHSASLTSAVGLDGVTPLAGTFTADSQTNAGIYTTDSWTFTPSDPNYSQVTGAVKDVINQAAPTVLVTGYTGTYDGNAHSASLTSAVGLDGTTPLKGTFTADSHTNAGTYTTDSWTFTPSDPNYSQASGTVTDVINQAAPTVVVAGYSGTYDGNAHSASLTSAVGLDGVTPLKGTFTADSHTNAGTYTTDSWSFTPSDPNYSQVTGTVKDVINQAAPTVVVAGYSGTYDGNAHSASLTSVVGLDGVTPLKGTFTPTPTSSANVGSYKDSWTFTPDDANYAQISGTVKDVISKADASISAAGYSVTYDGNVHTASFTALGVDGKARAVWISVRPSTPMPVASLTPGPLPTRLATTTVPAVRLQTSSPLRPSPASP